SDAARVELVRRGQLQQKHAEAIAKTRSLLEEALQRLPRSGQRALVADDLGDLHRKTEGRRDGCGPAGIGRSGVRTVERGVDLGGVQAGRVALKSAAVHGKAGL